MVISFCDIGFAAPGSVVYPAAAGDSLPGAVVDPGHGGGEVPVPDVAAQADAGLIEHGNAVEGAEPLPQHQHRGIEGPEDQGQQGVARLHGQLMLEGKGRLRFSVLQVKVNLSTTDKFALR